MNQSTYTWQNLFVQYGAALVLFARQWTTDHADAEDAVQEAFVKMIRKQAKPDDPAAYLFTAVRNAAIDLMRAATRSRVREKVASNQGRLFEPTSTSLEDADATEAALLVLPDEQREVVVMKIWGGMTFDRIAIVLETSPNTVASRYRYAIRAMRAALAPDMGVVCD